MYAVKGVSIMSDFDKLGQIPPEEFKKAMAIKDINQREAAIKI